MIAIVQYGCGNTQAIANIYHRLGVQVTMASTAEHLLSADRIILPGVGAFDWAMQRLNDSGMRETLERCALVERKPTLGICVGMQLMARSSDEGVLPGLNWIDGVVRKFDFNRDGERTYLPHMGWNDVQPSGDSALFEGLRSEARFYFLHSYYFDAGSPAVVLAQTDYHGVFASSVFMGNIHGVQFHPEKSHQWGVRLLKNFAEL